MSKDEILKRLCEKADAEYKAQRSEVLGLGYYRGKHCTIGC